jgi:hypothetical protein
MPDINLLPVEVNCCDKSILVAADVEDDPMIHLVRRWKYGP